MNSGSMSLIRRVEVAIVAVGFDAQGIKRVLLEISEVPLRHRVALYIRSAKIMVCKYVIYICDYRRFRLTMLDPGRRSKE